MGLIGMWAVFRCPTKTNVLYICVCVCVSYVISLANDFMAYVYNPRCRPWCSMLSGPRMRYLEIAVRVPEYKSHTDRGPCMCIVCPVTIFTHKWHQKVTDKIAPRRYTHPLPWPLCTWNSNPESLYWWSTLTGHLPLWENVSIFTLAVLKFEPRVAVSVVKMDCSPCFSQ